MDNKEIIELAKLTIEIERDALNELIKRIDNNFVNAVNLIYSSKSRIIVIGMGKSGLIGKKIASTFSSTGTPSFFVHPAELMHGDLGVISPEDVVILISNSGETEEIIAIIPSLIRLGVKIIGMTGGINSTLSKYSDVFLDVSVEKEACPLNAAPTASTTATLAMGDALAVSLIKKRGFQREDFAKLHPGGSLGKKYFLKIDDVMHSGDANPVVSLDALVKDAIIEITSKRLGATNVVSKNGELVGIITDGDLRRAIEKHSSVLEIGVSDIMTKNPTVIESGKLAVEAVHIMEDRPSQLMVLPVVINKKPIGMVRIHDLVKIGLV